jgi:hypothetical protein
VAESPTDGIGRLLVSFHWLAGGPVVGDHFLTSFTIGMGDRLELGGSRSSVAGGGDEALSSLFDRGFTSAHGKVRILDEDSRGATPAVAAGAIVRYQTQHLQDEGVLGTATQDGDIYVAATKTLEVGSRGRFIVTGGVKFTNASLFGFAGNAPSWTTRGFLAGFLNVDGRVEMGAEFVHQPSEIDGIGDSALPSTVAVSGRVFVVDRLSIQAAIVRLADEIAPGLDVRAARRFMLGAGFRF